MASQLSEKTRHTWQIGRTPLLQHWALYGHGAAGPRKGLPATTLVLQHWTCRAERPPSASFLFCALLNVLRARVQCLATRHSARGRLRRRAQRAHEMSTAAESPLARSGRLPLLAPPPGPFSLKSLYKAGQLHRVARPPGWVGVRFASERLCSFMTGEKRLAGTNTPPRVRGRHAAGGEGVRHACQRECAVGAAATRVLPRRRSRCGPCLHASGPDLRSG